MSREDVEEEREGECERERDLEREREYRFGRFFIAFTSERDEIFGVSVADVAAVVVVAVTVVTVEVKVVVFKVEVITAAVEDVIVDEERDEERGCDTGACEAKETDVVDRKEGSYGYVAEGKSVGRAEYSTGP